MNIFNYTKCAFAYIWFDNKLMLSRRLGKSFKNYYSCAGGKIEKKENILDGLKREIKEECNLNICKNSINLIDCYLLSHRNPPKKIFIFEIKLFKKDFKDVLNLEPHKHSNWKLFTKKDALKLKLMPHIKLYLINL